MNLKNNLDCKILVTGASGFLGSHLCEYLVKNKFNVTGLVRKISNLHLNENGKILLKNKLKIIEGDLKIPNSLKVLDEEFNYIFHLGGIARPESILEQEYFLTNVDGTKNLVENLKKNKIKKFILISSLAAVGPTQNKKILNENSPCLPVDFYGKSKLASEKVLINFFKKHNLPTIILRPPTIYGPRDKEFLKFIELIKIRFFPIRSDYPCIEYLSIDNFINGCLVVMKDGVSGEIYHITDGERYSLNKILFIISKYLKKKIFPLYFPIFLISMTGWLLEKLGFIFNFNPPFKSSTTKWLTDYYWPTNINKIKDIGYAPSFQLDSSIKKIIKYYENKQKKINSLVFRTNPFRIILAYVLRLITKKIIILPGLPLHYTKILNPEIPDPNFVKVKTSLCGICGTELNILGINISLKSSSLAMSGSKTKSDMYLGHEAVGKITEIGNNVSEFKIGQRVILTDDNNCAVLGIESCDFCIKGKPILCLHRNKKHSYKNLAGGWSEYFVRHKNQLILIPEDLEDRKAVLLEPLSVSLHSVLECAPKVNYNVLIIGSGIIGLGIILCLRALNLKNLKITCLARHSFQRDKSIECGADNVFISGDNYKNFSKVLKTEIFGSKKNRILNDGFNIVYDCVGNKSTINDSLRWLRPKGMLSLIGMNMLPNNFDLSPLWQREINIVGIHGYAYDLWEGKKMHSVERCIEWLKLGRISTKGLITHSHKISDYKNAIKISTSHHNKYSSDANKFKAIKTIFNFN